MDAISSRITAETEAAENGLARAIQVYFPQMPVPKEPAPDDGAFARIEQNLSQVDGALLATAAVDESIAEHGAAGSAGARDAGWPGAAGEGARDAAL